MDYITTIPVAYVRTDREDALKIHEKAKKLSAIITAKYDFADEPLVFFDNGYSGNGLDRPGLQSLLEGVLDGEISSIYIVDTSDLTRSTTDYYKLTEFLDEFSVEINIVGHEK